MVDMIKLQKCQVAYIEWIVAFAVMFLTTFSIFRQGINMLFPSLKSVISLINWWILLMLVHYQYKKFKLGFLSKGFRNFIILYSVYILLYITVLREYRLEDMLIVPTSVINFFSMYIRLFLYLLCAETIARYFNIRYFICLSVIFGLIPSLLYINWIGVDILQIYSADDDGNIIGRLTLAYTNAPILILTILNYKEFFKNRIISYIVSAIVVVGVSYILMVSTKRGPILWTIVTLLICFYYQSRKSFKYFIYLVVIGLVVYLSIDLILDFIAQFAPKSAERISRTIYEGDTAHRFDTDDAQNSGYLLGIKQFLSSPIWGAYFRITETHSMFKGCYPHNIFIELLMTMGLVGFIPFMIFLTKIAINIHRVFKHNYTPTQMGCFALFMITFLQLMTTGTIVNAFAFWLFFYIMLIMNYKIVR